MIPKIYQTDPWLEPYKGAIDARHERILSDRRKLAGDGPLSAAVNNHLYYPLHLERDEWVIREWPPGARRTVRLAGFGVTNFTDRPEEEQADLFDCFCISIIPQGQRLHKSHIQRDRACRGGREPGKKELGKIYRIII